VIIAKSRAKFFSSKRPLLPSVYEQPSIHLAIVKWPVNAFVLHPFALRADYE